MKATVKIGFLCLAVACCCTACLFPRQPANKISHYTLEYDPPQQAAGLQPLAYTLSVQPFTVAAVYNTRRIVYRDASFKREEYVYHAWRASPGELVADFLRRDLQQAGLFQAVLPYGSSAGGRYLLEGSVDQFLESEMRDLWEAALTLTITLLDGAAVDSSKRILFQKTYSSRTACEHKNPQSFVAAMSRAMAGLSAAVSRDVYDALKNAPVH